MSNINSITKKNHAKELTLKNIFVYILFIAIVIVASVLDQRFFTVSNFLVICKQTATTAVVAFGMTFAITGGEIDLAVGGVACLSGMIATFVLERTNSIAMASICGLSIGVVFGLLNGFLIAKVKMAAFLSGLGAESIATGIALTMTNQKPVTVYNSGFTAFWGKATILGIPVIVFWTFGIFLVCFVLYKYTPYGNHVKACGGNRTAAIFSGIKTDKIVMSFMLLSGICASICGMMTVSRMNQGRPDIGGDFCMDAITAVVLGGTPFTGGSGSVLTSLIGAFVITTLTNALVIVGVPTTAQKIVKGIVVIVAVTISTRDIKLGRKKQNNKIFE